MTTLTPEEYKLKEEEFIRNVKQQVLQILEEESRDQYEFRFNKEACLPYIKTICGNLNFLKGDIWKLTEVTASQIFAAYHNSLPGEAIIGYMICQIFKKGLENFCEKYNC